MRKTIAVATLAALFAIGNSGNAAPITVTYGWEDGSGTILGSFGTNIVDVANVTTGDEYSNSSVIVSGVTPNSGSRMLQSAESPHSGTPQLYLAYIEGLSPGDEVTATFMAWDSTDGGSPSQRIWGHYALNGDVVSYDGSASGPSTYPGDGVGDVNGWYPTTFTWTIPSGKQALVIEDRLYSSPSTADPAYSSFFTDDLTIDIDSSSSSFRVTTPGGTIVIPEPASGLLLALAGLGFVGLRRRITC